MVSISRGQMRAKSNSVGRKIVSHDNDFVLQDQAKPRLKLPVAS